MASCTPSGAGLASCARVVWEPEPSGCAGLAPAQVASAGELSGERRAHATLPTFAAAADCPRATSARPRGQVSLTKHGQRPCSSGDSRGTRALAKSALILSLVGAGWSINWPRALTRPLALPEEKLQAYFGGRFEASCHCQVGVGVPAASGRRLAGRRPSGRSVVLSETFGSHRIPARHPAWNPRQAGQVSTPAERVELSPSLSLTG